MSSPDLDDWDNRVLCALGGLASLNIAADGQAVCEMVAAQFASRFDAQARLFEKSKPHWQQRVTEAVDRLVGSRLVERPIAEADAGDQPSTDAGASALQLTAAGRRGVDDACRHAREAEERKLPPASGTPARDPSLAGVLTPALRQKFLENPHSDPPQSRITRWPVLIELNLRFGAGPAAAQARVEYLWRLVEGPHKPQPVGEAYLVGELTTGQLEGLVSADATPIDWPKRAIYRIWPDFPAHPQIDASGETIKARAAQRAFESFGDEIVWAVVDSGVWADHPHFQCYNTLRHPSVLDLHHDFTVAEGDPGQPLQDQDGHGTHVAGIIAGGLKNWSCNKLIAGEKRFNAGSDDDDFPIIQPRDPVPDPNRLAGMAPHAKLVSLKVLGDGDAVTRVSRVMQALAYVRKVNAANDKMPRIHGVNLSLGINSPRNGLPAGRSHHQRPGQRPTGHHGRVHPP